MLLNKVDKEPSTQRTSVTLPCDITFIDNSHDWMGTNIHAKQKLYREKTSIGCINEEVSQVKKHSASI